MIPKLRTFRSELRMVDEEEVLHDSTEISRYIPEGLQGMAAPTTHTDSATFRSHVSTSGTTKKGYSETVETKTTRIIQVSENGKLKTYHDEVDTLQPRATTHKIEREESSIRNGQINASVSRTMPDTREVNIPLSTQTVLHKSSVAVIPKGQVLYSLSITHPKTGQRLTIGEAVDIGLLDIKSGSFVDPNTGRRMSLSEAVTMGYMDMEMLEQLNRQSGVRDNNTAREISLLEAMQKGYINPVSKMVVDPKSGKEITVEQARVMKVISEDLATRLSYGAILTETTSHIKGLFNIKGFQETGLQLSLYDTVVKQLYKPETCLVIDPISKLQLTIEQAIAQSVIDRNIHEVVHPISKERITLKSALKLSIVDGKKGLFCDMQRRKTYTLDEAVKMRFIVQPLTLHTAIVEGHLHDTGLVTDPLTHNQLPFIEAIEKGVLDNDSKSVIQSNTGEILSLAEAMDKNVITERGQYYDQHMKQTLPICEAVTRQHIQLVAQTVDFAQRHVQDTSTNECISLQEAIDRGLLNLNTVTVVDTQTGKQMSVSEASRQGVLSQQLQSASGLRNERGREVTFLDAVREGLLDMTSGTIRDSRNQIMTIQQAVDSG